VSRYTELENWCIPDFSQKKFTSIAPLHWEIGCRGSGLWITVPSGFIFDVSVPKCLRFLIDPMNPKLTKAAALHDYAFACGWDRVAAASVFAEALRVSGVGRSLRLLLVTAVIIWHWS
jgi:hypothetical protein